MEEGVVLRRGSLVLAPSEEKSTVVMVPPPSVPNLHQQFGAHLVEGFTTHEEATFGLEVPDCMQMPAL
jgi:hypothetical protein